MRDTYGENVFYNSRRAKNILNDLCPHMHSERIQAKNFIEMNGYFILKHAGSAYPIVRDKLIEAYKGTYHVDGPAAGWIVDVFSALLGYIFLDSEGTKQNLHESDLHMQALNIMSGYRKQSEGYGARVISKPNTGGIHTSGRSSLWAVKKTNEPKPVKFEELKPYTPPEPVKINYILRHIAADYHTVAVKEDGTVIATGYNNAGQCNVWHWFDVVSVAAGSGFTVALRKNGTVVATGQNEFGQCNVGRWQDIVAISTGARHTLGLCADGTVLATGENRYGECNVSGWRNIIAVFGGNQCTYGIKKDKRVLARGYNKNMDYDTSLLTDVIRIADANPYGALALRSNGTVVKARQLMKGDFSRIHSLTELIATPDCFIGLLKNGTVRILAYYWESSGVECAPNEWTDVCEIASGRYHIIGLRRDGTVLADMLHTNKSLNRGQCNVGLWSGVRVES